ncbi:B-4DMT family transporter [Mycolicibacterium sp.]|uniref:B-4DMT family transporter n=1 Tax=Mycolicibacterium sp. TaxID=2320850 RepID=UPI001A2A123A|nr:B-4DMT family transporter [Mycolicibacterium sp.]MBJ7338558.1 B-4DMT family transporter [Mycolicibacterium sp.]
MGKWLLRGLVFAALMVIVRLLQGALINLMEGQALWISILLVAVFAIAAFVWGLLDGRADARANPDPDRRGDLAMTWLLGGLFAGIVSGFVAWFISLFYENLYAQGLLNEVTTFAAFTALLMFVFALAGVALGRALVDRNAPPIQRKGADADRADTDVFAAVHDDRADDGVTVPAGETAPTAVEERP